MSKDKPLIEDVFTVSKNQSKPVLLKFQNGNLNTSHKDTTLYFPVNCRAQKTRRSVVIAGGNVYSGTVGEGVSTELTDTYICVRNKTSNKVRILPIDQVKLINHVYQEKETFKFDTMTKETSRALMMRNFGGRRDVRYLANQERSDFKIDVVKDQLETTVNESMVLDRPEPTVSAEDNISRIRPPFNKEATKLDEIFSVNDVIPSELIDRLDEEASVIYQCNLDDIPISSEFLKNIIKTLITEPKSTRTLLKLKMIIYMDALQTLIKSKNKKLKQMELSKVTEKVENNIRETFADQNSKNKMRTSYSNEKALCYYLVLAFLISEKFDLDLDVLSQELCMPKQKIVKLGHLVNATPKPRSNILMLRLPSSMKPMALAFAGKRKK